MSKQSKFRAMHEKQKATIDNVANEGSFHSNKLLRNKVIYCALSNLLIAYLSKVLLIIYLTS